MLLNSNNDILVSSNSTFKLTVGLSNYYIKPTDEVILTVNGVSYPCTVEQRVNIKINMNVDLPSGNYKYDLAIVNDDKRLTILSGDFIVKRSLKDYLINLVHKLYRGDTWLNNIFDSAGVQLAEIEAQLDITESNMYFDTASENQLRKYEKEAKVNLLGGQTLDDRRSQLMAKWKGASKCTLETLQAVADSWRNATIKVEFRNGKIHIKFISPVGIPSDLPALKQALELVKPAHLAFEYTFLYKTWGTAKTAGTWGFHKNNGEWNKLRQNE